MSFRRHNSDMDASKVKASLVGLVVGDAFCMPVHWYYDVKNLKKDYGEAGPQGMLAPKRVHPESMVSMMTYGGTLDILHDKAELYEGSRPTGRLSAEERAKRSDKHGNFVGRAEDERIHYHVTLKKGQNTCNVAIARLLMRDLAEKNSTKSDGYRPEAFLEAVKDYMTSKPEEGDDAQLINHNDAYLDVWVRKFFESGSAGVPLMNCACNQRDVWSIGSLDGAALAMPIIAAYRTDAEATLVGRAAEQAMLTHRSVTVMAAIAVLSPLLQQLWQGKDPDEALNTAMEKLRPPKITGEQMRESYVSSQGPAKIPELEKWGQHMEPSTDGGTLGELVHHMIEANTPLADVAGWLSSNGKARFSSACYVEHALAAVLYLAAKHKDDFAAAMRENALIGGHSTSRGAILGAIMGARVGMEKLPKEWVSGLAAPEQVLKEAQGVVDSAVTWG
mmetsp:Transcript_34092/g.96640  ORF Transcript_34092/g.96640 Transcript_34092/m.96640 type:complete len:447 (-) Transcript_34092:138-1478(-)